MTKTERDRVVHAINRDGGIVQSLRHWSHGSWDVVVKDPLTGYTGVISSLADWRERVRANNLILS